MWVVHDWGLLLQGRDQVVISAHKLFLRLDE